MMTRTHGRFLALGAALLLALSMIGGTTMAAGDCILTKGANVAGCDLSGNDYAGDDLTRANISGATLIGTTFSGAILTRANLSGSDATGADFSGATAPRSTNMKNMDLTNANLSGLQGDVSFAGSTFCNTTMPDGNVNNSGC